MCGLFRGPGSGRWSIQTGMAARLARLHLRRKRWRRRRPQLKGSHNFAMTAESRSRPATAQVAGGGSRVRKIYSFFSVPRWPGQTVILHTRVPRVSRGRRCGRLANDTTICGSSRSSSTQQESLPREPVFSKLMRVQSARKRSEQWQSEQSRRVTIQSRRHS